jgi:glucose-1-phosphate cytidylyltransferase
VDQRRFSLYCTLSVIDRIAADETPWEAEPLTSLAAENKLMAYYHRGFWQAMDTLRDKNQLEELWTEGGPRGKCGHESVR